MAERVGYTIGQSGKGNFLGLNRSWESLPAIFHHFSLEEYFLKSAISHHLVQAQTVVFDDGDNCLKKQAIGRIFRFFPKPVTKSEKPLFEVGISTIWKLKTNEDTAVVATLHSVMKE